MKKQKIINFDVEKLSKYKGMKRKGIILLLIFLFAVVYSSYQPTFIGIVIIAWLGLIYSVVMFWGSILLIKEQNRAKNRLINLIRDNYTSDLLELARKIEYPYSILKQVINYLESKNERFF